jgi:hypothetical protein
MKDLAIRLWETIHYPREIMSRWYMAKPTPAPKESVPRRRDDLNYETRVF